MKKILIAIISIVLFYVYNVKASEIIAEKIDDYFIYDTVTKNKYDLNIYKDNNEVFYCLGYNDEWSKDLSFGYSVILKDILNVSDNDVNRIRNIIYFGYGYEDHDNFPYYLVTQYMLFEELELNYIIIDKNNNDLKVLYSDYFDKISKLLNEFYVVPSFFAKDIDLNYNEKYYLVDTNGVLSTFDLSIQYPGLIKKDGDKFYISSVKPGQVNMYVTKKVTNKDFNKIYYNDDMVLINRAGLGAITSKVKVNIHGIGIGIKNISEDGMHLKNSLIEIYNSNDEKVFGVFLDSNGSFENKYFPLDNYYIIQKTVEDGYVKILDKIWIEVNDYNKTEVLIVNEKPKAKVTINLNYIFKNKQYGEENATFEIYKNDVLLESKKTDEKGYLEFLLPFGEYTLKQSSSSMNFRLQDEKFLRIESTDELLFDFLNFLEEDNIIEEEEPFVSEEPKEIPIENIEDEVIEHIFVDVPNTGMNINVNIILVVLIICLVGILFYVKKL